MGGTDRAGQAEATTGASALPAQVGLVGSGAGAVQLETSRRAASGEALSRRAPWVSLLISTEGSCVFFLARPSSFPRAK